MKFAICNETFPSWPWQRTCEYAAQIGYLGIEIAPFTLAAHPREIGVSNRREIRRQAEGHGLQIVGLHWLLAKTEGLHLTSPDSEVRRRTANYLRELVILSAEIGGKILVLGSPVQRRVLPGVDRAAALEFAGKILQAVQPDLESHGQWLALEPLAPVECNFLRTAAEARELIRRAACPNVRLHLDAKAMSAAEASICNTIHANRDLLIHFHANDPNLRGPGMGELDFRPILKALADIDYSGWVSVEVFDITPGPERLAEESLAYLQRASGTAWPR
jgi:sugar phosphate isomerase/epimerase